ncbi:MAG: winged helix-turn-helix domain-containing protein [Candidatus Omnitrophica bacterium]|nr:winged helix-turn-helix domain-containing protein [Candidatus Omnitrophota bacterium]
MITKIGITAGDIWYYLEKHQRSGLTKIGKGIDKPRDDLLMSIGWLAREGHIVVEKLGDEYEVWLRESEPAR